MGEGLGHNTILPPLVFDVPIALLSFPIRPMRPMRPIRPLNPVTSITKECPIKGITREGPALFL